MTGYTFSPMILCKRILLKVMPPILLCCTTTSDVVVSDVTVEVEPSVICKRVVARKIRMMRRFSLFCLLNK